MILNFFRKTEKRVEKKFLPFFDDLFYLGAILNPIVAFPQAYKIFSHHSAEGVSLITWLSYFGAAFALALYGYVHKQRPILLMNLTVIPVHLAIIIGILLYK